MDQEMAFHLESIKHEYMRGGMSEADADRDPDQEAYEGDRHQGTAARLRGHVVSFAPGRTSSTVN